MIPLRVVLHYLLLFSFLGGCTFPVYIPPAASSSHVPAPGVRPAAASLQISSGAGVSTTDSQGAANLARVALLWQERTQEGAASDYPIGPGDVLEIAVPAMEELSNRTVRVSGEGTISLPFIGAVQASGLTEEGLREEIHQRLEADYMYNPQVNLFVREYRSRQVAVVGAVEKPGLYSLASGADTLLDMISLAGGLKEEAAPRIHFIPAEPVEKGKAKELASALPAQLLSKDSPPLLLQEANPIEIDFTNFTNSNNQLYLTLPARPGDVIMVPGGGDILVEGWVEKPGSYKITPGLTALGAVAAAGGPLFAANTTSVQIIRMGEEGAKSFFLANLEKIKHGESPDIPVQEGDVIEVSSSTSKLVPYSFYHFFASVFHVGALVGP